MSATATQFRETFAAFCEALLVARDARRSGDLRYSDLTWIKNRRADLSRAYQGLDPVFAVKMMMMDDLEGRPENDAAYILRYIDIECGILDEQEAKS